MSARIDGLFRCTFKRTEVVTFVTDERFVCVPHPQKQNPRWHLGALLFLLCAALLQQVFPLLSYLINMVLWWRWKVMSHQMTLCSCLGGKQPLACGEFRCVLFIERSLVCISCIEITGPWWSMEELSFSEDRNTEPYAITLSFLNQVFLDFLLTFSKVGTKALKHNLNIQKSSDALVTLGCLIRVQCLSHLNISQSKKPSHTPWSLSRLHVRRPSFYSTWIPTT